MFVYKLWRKIVYSIMYLPRKMFYNKLKKKLINTDFTIISSDCFGGLVYHNLAQRFNSPTINLYFSQTDFINFVSNLKEYLSKELVEVLDHNMNHPVGKLSYNGVDVVINFMHYSSFEYAKKKWDERKNRVDFQNIYIIQTLPRDLTREYIETFENLPFDNKLLITKNNRFNSDCIVSHPIFSSKNYKPGKILEYKSLVSLKRYMDDIDYVKFLNKKQKN